MAHRSFAALCRTVEVYTGAKTAGAALAHVQAGYERVLLGLDPRDNGAYLWSFLQPVADLSIAAAIAGVATGVYDAVLLHTTVTATTAIFVPSQVGSTLTVTDGGGAGVDLALEIESYVSATCVVATGGNDFTAKAVSLPHTGIYTLPEDFGGLLEAPVYPYSALASKRWEEHSPEEVFAAWRLSKTAGTAWLYAVVPLSQVGLRVIEYGYATLSGGTVEVPTNLASVEAIVAMYAADPGRADPLVSDGTVTAAAITLGCADPMGNEKVWYFAAGPISASLKQRWALIVAPRPEADRTLRIRYVQDAPPATDSDAQYPVGWPLMGSLYEAAALADAEAKNSREPGRWETRYQQLMAGSIDVDRSLFKTQSPARQGD